MAEDNDNTKQNDPELNAVMETIRKAVTHETNAPMPATDYGDYNSHSHTMLEAMTIETLEPILRKWVNENLPALVEKMIREEMMTMIAHYYKSKT